MSTDEASPTATATPTRTRLATASSARVTSGHTR